MLNWHCWCWGAETYPSYWWWGGLVSDGLGEFCPYPADQNNTVCDRPSSWMIVQPDEITDAKTAKSKLVLPALLILLPSGQYWFMHALALHIPIPVYPIPVYMYTFAMTNILHTSLLRHILAFSLPESCWYYCILSCTKSPNLCCPFLLVGLHNSNAIRSESQSTPTMASLAAWLTMPSQ